MTRAASSISTLRRRLVLLCAVLAAVLALLWLTPAPLAPWRQWSAPAPQPPALGEFAQAALQVRQGDGMYEQALQRPLFVHTRRPAARSAAEEAPPAPTQRIEQVRLLGLVDAQGASGAMLEIDGATHFVRVGEDVPGAGGWRLAALEPRAVRFANARRHHRIGLPFLENLGAAPPAPGASEAPAAQRRRRH